MLKKLIKLTRILAEPGLTDRQRRVEIMEIFLHSRSIEGAVLEVGCNKGVTSSLIQFLNIEGAIDKEFHVYDTFSGLIGKTDKDGNDGCFQEGMLCSPMSEFRSTFKKFDLPEPVIHEGRAEEAEYPDKVSFAYVDLDYYKPTLEVISKIWPKISKGGVVIIDDYNYPRLPGVKLAVNDYFKAPVEERGILCVLRK